MTSILIGNTCVVVCVHYFQESEHLENKMTLNNLELVGSSELVVDWLVS